MSGFGTCLFGARRVMFTSDSAEDSADRDLARLLVIPASMVLFVDVNEVCKFKRNAYFTQQKQI